MEEGKGRVCVTGGTGFIGSWIIKRLLEDGYTVNTTVRADPAGQNKDVSFLTNLPNATQKLNIFNADLSNPKSFNAAIEGCIGVFHTATPIDFELEEPEEIVTKRTIDGALGILKACKNSKTLKRVIYTSSASAVYTQDKEEDTMDESYWSDVNILRTLKPFAWSYGVSKTLAEKAVLEFGEQHGLDIVTLVPPFVVGPFICPKLPGSVHSLLAFLFGDIDKHSLLLVSRTGMVHVDDVARAHIFLLEHPNPKGRYNCSPFIATIDEIADLVSSKYPELQMPTSKELIGVKGSKLPQLTSKKLMDAGFKFKYSLEKMFEDAVECCKEKGYL
ncbi:putative vestitone reductase [Medicago truncatula]|uniref:Putative vestitone reductase n=1 Tax=Medicago truncatula TaxID=3880 RepID=A0A396H223_MEDTR|nr:vestitone reductase isoform X1 [Medicago truncatula]RHN46763.1 putative vestitone reductase [Medicago truncatula]